MKPHSTRIPSAATRAPETTPANTPPASTAEEAAQQFEEVLVRQFVQVMTNNMFSAGLTGHDSPQWMDGQRTQQRDALTDILTRQLVDADVLPFSELLVRQWKQGGITPSVDSSAAGHPLDQP